MSLQIGQSVRLVPTQGAHQREKPGTVTSITRTQVGVTADGEQYEVRYRIADGFPVRKFDGYPEFLVDKMPKM
ncbi:hypothetical protein [Pseudomonas aeruginosa]|uniref:hypothetical protein n=1 Tax=Pseudomonas aeruginosa TaxID=287 RepID=UPI00146CFB78|nr:hypothetical protein [Pseudomonas aeruginosa]HDQ4517318.1 hypothetical protein [Pseudomonas aeruginosa]